MPGKHDSLQKQPDKAKVAGRTNDAKAVQDRTDKLSSQPLDKKRKLDADDTVRAPVDQAREQPKSKKSKKSRDRTGVETTAAKPTISKTSKKDKLGSINGTPAVKKVVEEEIAWEPSDEDDTADHTAALLQGFESSSDEEGSDTGEGDGDAVSEVPSIPGDAHLAKKLKSASNDEDEPGVIYVG